MVAAMKDVVPPQLDSPPGLVPERARFPAAVHRGQMTQEEAAR
jgi:hypothetical protein